MIDIFAHSISRADFLEGMVRLELVTLVPGENAPDAVAKHAIYLPLEGFLRAASTMDNFLRELSKAGIVKSASPPPAPQHGSGSPNFV
ncbi:MAG: hypothetical protein HQL37_10500 [Alphaproteobacteria bacterium]|nr:hypothetical protein [Alphaproteobacteria bacterium]